MSGRLNKWRLIIHLNKRVWKMKVQPTSGWGYPGRSWCRCHNNSSGLGRRLFLSWVLSASAGASLARPSSSVCIVFGSECPVNYSVWFLQIQNLSRLDSANNLVVKARVAHEPLICRWWGPGICSQQWQGQPAPGYGGSSGSSSSSAREAAGCPPVPPGCSSDPLESGRPELHGVLQSLYAPTPSEVIIEMHKYMNTTETKPSVHIFPLIL